MKIELSHVSVHEYKPPKRGGELVPEPYNEVREMKKRVLVLRAALNSKNLLAAVKENLQRDLKRTQRDLKMAKATRTREEKPILLEGGLAGLKRS